MVNIVPIWTGRLPTYSANLQRDGTFGAGGGGFEGQNTSIRATNCRGTKLHYRMTENQAWNSVPDSPGNPVSPEEAAAASIISDSLRMSTHDQVALCTFRLRLGHESQDGNRQSQLSW